MSRIQWDKVGEKRYETGVDRGVLYLPNNMGVYNTGFGWNGLTGVTESPSGAESNKQYANNHVYANLKSAEEWSGTIEAFTYPIEFEQCDGTATMTPGVAFGQQTRRSFGFSYRTLIGNDLAGADYGYKIHLVYGADAAPSEKAAATINDSPEAVTFSWEVTSTPVEVGVINGKQLKPMSTVTIDSTQVDADALADLENLLYGTQGTDPQLPLPAQVYALFSGTVTEAEASAPTYNSTTKVITIPTVTGVDYFIDGEVVTGTVTITEDTVVTARPKPGYKFPAVSDDDWFYNF